MSALGGMARLRRCRAAMLQSPAAAALPLNHAQVNKYGERLYRGLVDTQTAHLQQVRARRRAGGRAVNVSAGPEHGSRRRYSIAVHPAGRPAH